MSEENKGKRAGSEGVREGRISSMREDVEGRRGVGEGISEGRKGMQK